MSTLEFKGKQSVYSHHLSVPFRELIAVPEKSLTAPPMANRRSKTTSSFTAITWKRSKHCCRDMQARWM